MRDISYYTALFNVFEMGYKLNLPIKRVCNDIKKTNADLTYACKKTNKSSPWNNKTQKDGGSKPNEDINKEHHLYEILMYDIMEIESRNTITLKQACKKNNLTPYRYWKICETLKKPSLFNRTTPNSINQIGGDNTIMIHETSEKNDDIEQKNNDSVDTLFISSDDSYDNEYDEIEEARKNITKQGKYYTDLISDVLAGKIN